MVKSVLDLISRHYIYIDDVCKMLKAIIEYDGNETVFNVSTGAGTSQNAILNIVKELGMKLMVHYSEFRDVDVHTSVLDNGRIRGLYKGELCNINDGIKRYYEYLRRDL